MSPKRIHGTRHIALLALALLTAATPVHAWSPKAGSLLANAITEISSFQSTTVPASGEVEVAFSPDEGAERLVIKSIDTSALEIHMLAYSFTSAPVTQALLRARKRGVSVHLVADYKNNVTEDRSGKARAALSALATAGADVRTISAYAIHHDKVIVVDRKHLQTGSFNYSASAAHRNSENVIVHWNNPKLASVFLGHFDRNYRQAQAYKAAY